MWVGFILVFTALAVFDEWLGDDSSEPAYGHPAALDAMLYLALPALGLLAFCFAWMLGDGDPLGFGTWALSTLGWDLFGTRAATGPFQMLGGVLSVGLTYAAVGTNIGHELSHRIDDRSASSRSSLPESLTRPWVIEMTSPAASVLSMSFVHFRLPAPLAAAVQRKNDSRHDATSSAAPEAELNR